MELWKSPERKPWVFALDICISNLTLGYVNDVRIWDGVVCFNRIQFVRGVDYLYTELIKKTFKNVTCMFVNDVLRVN